MLHELQVHQIELEMQNEELRNTQAEVEAAAARYADLYDFAPVGYFTLDFDGAITQANLAGAQLLGLERARVLGKRLGVFLAAADVGAFNACRQHAVAAPGHPSSCEVVIESRGQLKETPLKPPVRTVHLVATLSDDGRELRVVVIDLTASKQAEAQVRMAEDKFRAIFEHAAQGIFQTTPQGRFLSANPALARILGYDSPEALIREITDVGQQVYVDPADRPRVLELLSRHGAVTKFENQVRRKDGRIIWIAQSPREVRDPQGRLLYYEGSFEDITERKQAEAALRVSESRHRRLIESGIIGVMIADIHGGITEANDAFLRMVGHTRAELAAGRVRWDALTPPEWRAVDAHIFAELKKSGTCAPVEKEYFHQNGGRVPILASVALLEGTADECICLIEDLTSRR
ncbi:MAG: PAS domain S-box protein, partial [Opitutaceae bacterium]